MMRIFQTTILPEELVTNYNLSFAAVNFSKNLISGNGFNRIFSLIPTNVNAPIPNINDTNYEIIYSSFRTKGKFLSKISIFLEQYTLFHKIHSYDSMWFYNLNIINSFLFILLMLFKPSVKRNVILLDYTPARSWTELNYWFLKLINKSNGIISLSTSELFTVKNKAILPGVVPASIPTVSEVEEIKYDFLISGVLSENISMLEELIIPSFKRMKGCILHITGNVDNVSELYNMINGCDNIIYHGKISTDKYFNILSSITFLLSTRNPTYLENQCNFPSKIIEALLHNRIVVSTLHYPQLDGIKYFEVSHDVNDFVKDIESIISLPENQLLTYANQSNVVAKRFSTEVWNETMKRIEENG